MKRHLRFSVGTKLSVSFLLLSVVLLVVVGVFTMIKMNEIGRVAEESSVALGTAAATDSARLLEEIGETTIEQKAIDVAGQVRIYLAAHPDPVNTPDDLHEDPSLVDIALQTVGETGYTTLYENSTGIVRIHPNAELINFDMHNWAETLPSFWQIFEKSLGGSVSSGYYDWQDPDGTIRAKFMYMVPVEGTPYMVAATTYIDEFSKPVTLIQDRMAVLINEATDRIQNTIDNTRSFFIIFFVAALLAVGGMVFLLSRMITGPIKALTAGSETIGRGNLDYKVEIHTGDELEALANSFNKMASDLRRYTADLRRTTAERERVERELEIARGIQQSFLPEAAPLIQGVDLAALNLPAKEVGGDFYDFIPVGSSKWGLVIADVSGKGVPGALFMALSRTLVRVNVNDTVTASEAICRSNELIAQNDRSNMFVTLFYGVLDPVRKTLTYVNAGHNPPLVQGKSPVEIIMLAAKGVALGVMTDIEFEEKEIVLHSGDMLILYTDGVTESVNRKNEMFGYERISQIVEKNYYLSAQEIIQIIEKEVINYSEGQPQFDDITLLLVKVI